MVGRRPSQQSVASDDGGTGGPASKMAASFKYLSKSSSSGSSHKEHRPSQMSNSSSSSNSSSGTASTTTPASIHLQPNATYSSVISSIPYESISTKSKSPIPVTYLPSNNDPRRSIAVSGGDSTFVPAATISGPIPPLPNRIHSHGSISSPIVGSGSVPSSSSIVNGGGSSGMIVQSSGSSYQLSPVISNMSSISTSSSAHAAPNSGHFYHAMNPPRQRTTSNSNKSSHRHSRSGDHNSTASRRSSFSIIDDDTMSIRSTKTSKSSIFGMNMGPESTEMPPVDDVERMFVELMVS